MNKGKGKNMKMRWMMAVLLAVLGLVQAGCRNTAHGVGEDVEQAGEKIQEKTD